MERSGGANCEEVVYLAYRRGGIRRRNGPSDAPSRHTVSLRHAIDGDCAIAHALERSHGDVARAVENDVLVDFVSDRKSIPAHTEVADEFQFLAREHLARGIVRCIYNDRFGVGTKGTGQFFAIEAPIRRPKLYKTGRGAGENRVRTVVLIVRLEDDHLIARLDCPHHCGHHGLGRTAAYGNLLFGIDAHALPALELPCDGVA